MGCINSKATVHPASLDDDDDDVVVSRPSVSPPAQDGAGDAVAQLNEKIVSRVFSILVAHFFFSSSRSPNTLYETEPLLLNNHSWKFQ